MLPIFVSTANTEHGRDGGSRRNLKVGLLGLVAMLALGVILLFSGNVVAAFSGMAVVVMTVIALAVLVVTGGQRERDTGKQKRGLDGVDMYTLIDRMVDDLDEDELAYLRRRLEREQKEDDLPQRMTNLLDQREEGRQIGRR